ncbi:MAG: trypsin-like peptidase domain-containing protein, partial [Verrucomicrobia bacterium]|nr:trypsin-like peptidase domain-containing protein [Verrucomicrobiota bacterium]
MKTLVVRFLPILPLIASPLLLTTPWTLRATEALDLARQLNVAFAAAAEKAAASVVVITVTSKTGGPAPEGNATWDLPDLSPEIRRFFEGKMARPEPAPARDLPVRIAYENQGSGVILREDGFLLTNAHVVENAEKISVRFPDGSDSLAEVAGTDAASDLAVLKVKTPRGRAARMGDSDRLKVGEFAIAIGAPFELDASVTFGHISAKGRQNILEDQGLDQDFLQTDAQINPGNSGGPLVNIEGEVIGINTLIRGMRTGIGFAIPINQAREVAEQLMKHGRYTRPWLGIAVRSLRENPEWRDVFPECRDGIVVKEIDAA